MAERIFRVRPRGWRLLSPTAWRLARDLSWVITTQMRAAFDEAIRDGVLTGSRLCGFQVFAAINPPSRLD